MSSFGTDFAIAIGVAAAGTIVALILVCTLAHCGPRLCGMGRKDQWFASDVEKHEVPGPNSPFITSGEHLEPRYA
ncbi:hypothetical protein NPX13_g1251 [Xylaria arbuscula]|uniref:Uncharacterized protein n=1 Tax=Xylaria arbuscula TaxID=114810 RepID=A0A9W8TRE3_9PEZI|nr:hypothetical protein NPX13_g1251 [Xylaria arbuscula]